MALLPRKRIIFSCAVGDPNPVELPGFLRALAKKAPLEILLHDYFPISPSYTLLDSDGAYSGPPKPDTSDPAHSFVAPDGSVTPLAAWQAEWRTALGLADRITAFSKASRNILAQAYPELSDRITVSPHKLIHMPPALTPKRNSRAVIGVLGDLAPHKGAAVVEAVSRKLPRAGTGLVVLGRLAPGFGLASPAKVHGGYALTDLADLVDRYGITCWLIPSIWPETFSYTTHECLATGLPVMAFDLGAQGDALREAENSRVINWPAQKTSPDFLADAVLATLDKLP